MPELFTNNARSAPATAIDSADLTITLTSGHGARFPNPTASDFFWVTLEEGPAEMPTAREIVRCTGRSIDVLTVTRAQQGTLAQDFTTDARVELRLTAATMEGLRDALGLPRTRPRGFFGPSAGGGTAFTGYGQLSGATATGTPNVPALATTSQLAGTPRAELNGTGLTGLAPAAETTIGLRGSAGGLGGFEVIARNALVTDLATLRILAGVKGTSGLFALNGGEPTSLTTLEFVAFGFESSTIGSNWRLFHCDGGGSVTNLDTSIPRNTSSIFQMRFFSRRGEAAINCELVDLETRSRYFATLTTNIPAAGTGLFYATTGFRTAGVATGLAYMGAWSF